MQVIELLSIINEFVSTRYQLVRYLTTYVLSYYLILLAQGLFYQSPQKIACQVTRLARV